MVPPYILTTNQPGVGPYVAVLQGYSPIVGAVTATGGIANDGTPPTDDACTSLPAGSLAGKLGLAIRGACVGTVKTTNVEAAGAVGTILYNNSAAAPIALGGSPTGVYGSWMISQADGLALKTAITNFPNMLITIAPDVNNQVSNFNVFENNTIVQHQYGILCQGDKESIISGNTISSADVGIQLVATTRDWIDGNMIAYVKTGIQDVGTTTLNPSTSLVTNNQVFYATSTPYDVTYAFGPVPVVSSSLVVGFPPLPTVSGQNFAVN